MPTSTRQDAIAKLHDVRRKRKTPLRVRTISHWCKQIRHVMLPGGVEPCPYASGEDLANPPGHSVFAIAYQRAGQALPLHYDEIRHKSKLPEGLFSFRQNFV